MLIKKIYDLKTLRLYPNSKTNKERATVIRFLQKTRAWIKVIITSHDFDPD